MADKAVLDVIFEALFVTFGGDVAVNPLEHLKEAQNMSAVLFFTTERCR
jgi:hypothetical protein